MNKYLARVILLFLLNFQVLNTFLVFSTGLTVNLSTNVELTNSW